MALLFGRYVDMVMQFVSQPKSDRLNTHYFSLEMVRLEMLLDILLNEVL